MLTTVWAGVAGGAAEDSAEGAAGTGFSLGWEDECQSWFCISNIEATCLVHHANDEALLFDVVGCHGFVIFQDLAYFRSEVVLFRISRKWA